MKHNLLIGVICALLSTLFYSSLTAINKAYAFSLPLPLLVFIQSAMALICFLPLLFRSGLDSVLKTVKTKRLPLHLFRACASLSISYLLFSAVKFIPLVNAMLLSFTAPLIIPFVAFILFSQKINHQLWIPLLIGFAGVALVLHPDGHLFNPAALLALGSAFCIAITTLLVRKLSSTESSETITFYFLSLSTLISGCIAIKYIQPISLQILIPMLIAGGLYFTSQYLMSIALRFSNAQLIGSLLYANIVYSAIISAVVWHHIPAGITLIGIILTVLGGILCIRAEHLKNKRVIEVNGIVYAKE